MEYAVFLRPFVVFTLNLHSFTASVLLIPILTRLGHIPSVTIPIRFHHKKSYCEFSGLTGVLFKLMDDDCESRPR